MKLDDYIVRIGYNGPLRPDLDCLRGVHRAHALNIPYENIDVQLGRQVDLDIDRIFEKIVIQRRGGWCFEMNGLLGWALGEIGFDFTRVNGAVRREERGDEAIGNHLILLVHLDQTYLADVGIGDTIREPTPLTSGAIQQGDLAYELTIADGDFWRLKNHPLANPPSFDFREQPADEELFQSKNQELQTHPDSIFVQYLVCTQMRQNSTLVLVDRVLEHVKPEGGESQVIESANELETILADEFGIREPDVKSLWPRLCERHQEDT